MTEKWTARLKKIGDVLVCPVVECIMFFMCLGLIWFILTCCHVCLN